MADIRKNITILGTNWCPDCKRAKKFLHLNNIPFEWIDIEDDEGAKSKVLKINNGKAKVPVIIFPDDDILIEPDNLTLANKLGISIGTATGDSYDVVIIGGGPAGMTTALYARRSGSSVLLIEESDLGGQIVKTTQIDNFPGFPGGISGAEFAQKLETQVRGLGVEIYYDNVTSIIKEQKRLVIETHGNEKYYCQIAIVATGASYNKLEVPGENELISKGVHYCSTCDGPFYKDKDVLVIGGGNSAFEEALKLGEIVKNITIIVRKQPRADKIFQDKVSSKQNIKVMTGYSVGEFILSEGKLNGVRLIDEGNESKTLFPAGVFVFIGSSPNTRWLSGIELDGNGYIITSSNLMSNIPGVFAAGDVRSGSIKQAVIAAGEGAAAAIAAGKYLDT